MLVEKWTKNQVLINISCNTRMEMVQFTMSGSPRKFMTTMKRANISRE